MLFASDVSKAGIGGFLMLGSGLLVAVLIAGALKANGTQKGTEQKANIYGATLVGMAFASFVLAFFFFGAEWVD